MSLRRAILPSVNVLASYLHYLKQDISPIKLQKSLYFLYAYHGAFYNQSATIAISEGTMDENVELFEADFEAWKYGPVIREVYFKKKNHEYTDGNKVKEAVSIVETNPEIKKFIDDLFRQLDSVSDFTLVDRSHMDDVWKEAYQSSTSDIMNKELLIKEYIQKYVQ